MLEPENIVEKNVLVVGGGDSAIEAALALAEQNNVVLSYRGDSFGRIKIKNSEKIQKAISDKTIDVKFNTTVLNIAQENISLSLPGNQTLILPNDLVYIFAGGELPTQFLQKAGIEITTRFGHTVLKHDKKH